jgi:hypothetical protein
VKKLFKKDEETSTPWQLNTVVVVILVVRQTKQQTGDGEMKVMAKEHDWNEIWKHFNRLQKRMMATKTTRREFFEQPEDERLDFYNWIQRQAGEYSCWM